MHLIAAILRTRASRASVGLGRFVRTQRAYAYWKSTIEFPEITFSLANQRAMAPGFNGNASLQATATENPATSPQFEKNANQYESVLTVLIGRFTTSIASEGGVHRIPVRSTYKAMVEGISKLKGKLTIGAGMANTKLTEWFVGLKTAVCLLVPIQHRISQSLTI